MIELNTAKQKQVCTREFFEQRKGWGVASTAPIFIVGLPRSGSTLIEQILASHSAVEGTQELAEIPRYVLELQGRERDFESPRYPGVLAQLPAAEIRALRRKVSGRHAASIGPASRGSSTRCRTTSGTSG